MVVTTRAVACWQHDAEACSFSLCNPVAITAYYTSAHVNVRVLCIWKASWLGILVKSTILGLGPIYSRWEYCTQYSIWCTDWPNYSVTSQQTRRLTVHDGGLGTQIWTISLFQIPSRAITVQKLCRKSLFHCYLLSLLTVAVVREMLIRYGVHL